jgi:hypothetical protein
MLNTCGIRFVFFTGATSTVLARKGAGPSFQNKFGITRKKKEREAGLLPYTVFWLNGNTGFPQFVKIIDRHPRVLGLNTAGKSRSP